MGPTKKPISSPTQIPIPSPTTVPIPSPTPIPTISPAPTTISSGDDDDDGDAGMPMGAIVGIAVGGLLLVVGLIATIMKAQKKKGVVAPEGVGQEEGAAGADA